MEERETMERNKGVAAGWFVVVEVEAAEGLVLSSS